MVQGLIDSMSSSRQKENSRCHFDVFSSKAWCRFDVVSMSRCLLGLDHSHLHRFQALARTGIPAAKVGLCWFAFGIPMLPIFQPTMGHCCDWQRHAAMAHSVANYNLKLSQHWLVTVQLGLRMASLFMPVYGQYYFLKWNYIDFLSLELLIILQSYKLWY